jgi:hypothetical protein
MCLMPKLITQMEQAREGLCQGCTDEELRAADDNERLDVWGTLATSKAGITLVRKLGNVCRTHHCHTVCTSLPMLALHVCCQALSVIVRNNASSTDQDDHQQVIKCCHCH